jgi:hypothetical protein
MIKNYLINLLLDILDELIKIVRLVPDSLYSLENLIDMIKNN